MPELNLDMEGGHEVFLRREFLYDQTKGQGEVEPALIIGACSIEGQALTFHVLLESGALFWRLPIHAFCWKEDAPRRELHNLELWDNMSSHFVYTTFSYLKGHRVRCYLRDLGYAEGHYIGTFDYHRSTMSERYTDIGHKCAHFVKLDDGNFALIPNNRIQVIEPSFVVKPFNMFEGERPDYLVQSTVWVCEPAGDWVTSDDNKVFYGEQDLKKPGKGFIIRQERGGIIRYLRTIGMSTGDPYWSKNKDEALTKKDRQDAEKIAKKFAGEIECVY